MKNSTVRLVLWATVAYYGTLFVLQSLLPADHTAPLFLLVIPLLVLVMVLVGDLSRRATIPTRVGVSNPPSGKLAREVQDLARKIEVGSGASKQYFENILLARVREILVEKVALETGRERALVREVLANPKLGTGLLRDDRLYRLLYTQAPGRGPARVKMLADAVELVEAWKP